MRITYPRSFLSLLLIGFVIVAAPLVVALVVNAIGFERLASLSEQSVLSAVKVTQASRALTANVTGLERAARQYALAGEAPFLEAYRANRTAFQASLRAIDEMPLSGAQRTEVAAIAAVEDEIHTALSGAPPSLELSLRLAGDFDLLAERARVLVTLGDRVIDEGIEQVRAQAARSRNRDLWLLVALIPMAILLIAGFAFLIAKPIHQVSAGIRRLGEGEFGRPISVEGPADMVRLGEQLEWMRQRLLALEAQKTRFLQHVSHELKTPLTALREGSDLLSSGVVGNLNAEQREIALILRDKSLELRRLIEGLLNYSAAHASASILDARIVPLRDVVRRVLADRKLPMVAKAIRIDARCEAVASYCDEEKVRVVLDNLLSNAIRHSPERGVIGVRLYRDQGDAVLEVSDQGPGIPEGHRERVFEPFYRGDDRPDAPVEGSGLGLAIVREYVQLHGGSIEILPADGAHFRVRLPRRREAQAEAAA
jgi:two-component system sensor histidine kinase GlrK